LSVVSDGRKYWLGSLWAASGHHQGTQGSEVADGLNTGYEEGKGDVPVDMQSCEDYRGH